LVFIERLLQPLKGPLGIVQAAIYASQVEGGGELPLAQFQKLINDCERFFAMSREARVPSPGMKA
jgi:hypothetical protein